ncbi:MAG: ABC transporter permease subunit [Planctomycetes bacterium]|nr:ABC transporter permease subunit [Planctomycetota bacterium]
MFLFENPVLQRELLVNLRMKRAFVLQFLYVAVLGAIVWASWPREKQIDFASPQTARRLFNTFFLFQFVLVALMSPSYAASSISGEKERKTFEMLLASPLRPSAVLIGKLLSSMCYLGLLIFSSIPLLVLCYPLGGIGLTEILAAYIVLLLEAGTFGLLCLYCSSYFRHTAAALAVSYLAILPMALVGVLLWQGLRQKPESVQLSATLALVPVSAVLWTLLILPIRNRLLHPPDVGSEGKEVSDEAEERRQAVGLVIQRDQFPDRLFAPAKREDIMHDGANPVLDKELRSEIFSHGTLMLRVVITVSMGLAIPLMAAFLFFQPQMVAYYVGYVVVFNMLVGPVFTAPLVTGERERGTMDLLLTTVLRPWHILWAKLLSGLRVSTVLTLFLVWPMLLAYIFVGELHRTFLTTLPLFLGIILVTCLATGTFGLFCSVIFQRTAAALIVAYLLVLALFGGPVAAVPLLEMTQLSDVEIERVTITSPISAAFSVPMEFSQDYRIVRTGGTFGVHWYFLALYPPLCLTLWGLMLLVFRRRWQAG